MLFNSLDFIFFFLVVYALYLVLPHRLQNYWLLAASYFFYACWDWRFLGLVVGSTLINYVCALGLGRSADPLRRRLYLLAGVVTSLGLLFFFKYFNFFADSLARLLQVFGMQADPITLRIILPVGISFFTFQTMSYTIDVWAGRLRPTRDLVDFSLFVVFFPQLVAGPIERATHLLPQVQERRVITYDMLREGAWLVLLGFYKKVVLADNMVVFVNEIFNQPEQAHGLAIPVAVLAFAFQIYGDFSGYSDIARGTARLMGFDIMHNFRMPYFSANPSEFWRRWHISLSTWLRDYLYIPLGGNRGGTVATYRNLAITMLLGGLWHGAAWHFVAWGAYQGLLLIVHRLCSPWLARRPPARGARRALHVAGFFVLVCFGWMLFRVNRLADLPLLLRNIAAPFAFNGRVALVSMACFALPLLLLELAQERAGDVLVIKRWPAPARALCYAGLWAAILLSGAVETHEFIYFQF